MTLEKNKQQELEEFLIAEIRAMVHRVCDDNDLYVDIVAMEVFRKLFVELAVFSAKLRKIPLPTMRQKLHDMIDSYLQHILKDGI